MDEQKEYEKRYQVIRLFKKGTDSIRYFSWYKGVVGGCINGFADTNQYMLVLYESNNVFSNFIADLVEQFHIVNSPSIF